MSRYESLFNLACKIEWEGPDYFFEDYGFSLDDMPLDTPPQVLIAAKAVVDDPDDQAARRFFLSLLPME